MTPKHGNIRVIVVDDSPTARELLVAILQIAEGIHVIGTGSTGQDALRLVRRMRPDVLLMDINMPLMDGLEATEEIMAEVPTPIVLVTGTYMRDDLDLSFKAISLGALTVMAKPGLAAPEACEALVDTVRSMANVPVVRRWSKKKAAASPSPPPVAPASAPASQVIPPPPLRREELQRPYQIVGIASSTGGPGALATILRQLNADFPLPLLIVQHVTPGFAAGLAEWLNGETALRVTLAEHGAKPQPGVVLIAPDGYHMQMNYRGYIELTKEPAYNGLRPSANYMFHALARIYGPRAVGVILTGMGDDGADGIKALHDAGGLTLAQDEQSCIVYGMPREAVIRNGVSAIMTLDSIAQALNQLTSARVSPSAARDAHHTADVQPPGRGGNL